MISITVIVTVDGKVTLRQVGICTQPADVPSLVAELANNTDMKELLEGMASPQARAALEVGTVLRNSSITKAQALMDQLDARNYRTERMRVRNWIAAVRAGRMNVDAFNRKLDTMRAWLSVRNKGRRKR